MYNLKYQKLYAYRRNHILVEIETKIHFMKSCRFQLDISFEVHYAL